MSLTVVGSIAFDAVSTPFGSREKMLGGSAVHFSLASSFFTEVRPVGPVGDDFGDDEYAVLRDRGHYEYDLNTAHTDDTRLNVFGEFQPKLSDASRACDVLFLANIQPDLQRDVREQCGNAKFVALDSMNLWIDTARDSLLRTIETVDCVLLNDAEIRQLTRKPNLVQAARELRALGPKVVVAKQGEYGAALLTEEGFFGLPAFPLETVLDPTGAGDSFAGGFVGYLAAHGGEDLSYDTLCRAMAYGTAIASYNVEEFGTERVRRLAKEEIVERVGELQRITQFTDDAPVALR